MLLSRAVPVLVLAPPLAARAGEAEARHHALVLVVLSARVGHLGGLLAPAGEDRGRVARPLAAPEARRVVVRGAHHEVPERVEGERPDVRVVRLRERCARAGWLRGRLGKRIGGGRDVPVQDRAL